MIIVLLVAGIIFVLFTLAGICVWVDIRYGKFAAHIVAGIFAVLMWLGLAALGIKYGESPSYIVNKENIVEK